MPSITHPLMSQMGFVNQPSTLEPDDLQRYFTTLNPAAGGYFEIPRVEIAAGQDFEFECWISPNAGVFYALGDSVSGNASDRLAASVEWYGAGASASIPITGGNSWKSDGKLHKLTLKRLSGSAQILIDESVNTDQFASSASISFDRLGGKFGGTTSIPSFSGVYADTKLWLNGDKTTGTLERHYKIDQNTNSITDLINAQNGLGVNVSASDRELYESDNGGASWIGQTSGRVLEVVQ